MVSIHPFPSPILRDRKLVAPSQVKYRLRKDKMPATKKTQNKRASEAPERPDLGSETPKFIRNLRHVQVGISLDKTDPQNRIDLKPRGQRGDTIPLDKKWLENHIFHLNHNLLFEVINWGEGYDTIQKQGINMQSVQPDNRHLFNDLRDENDQPYTKHRILPPTNAEGTIVDERDSTGQWHRADTINPPHYETLGTVDKPFDGQPSLPPQD